MLQPEIIAEEVMMFSFEGAYSQQHIRICTFSSVGTSPQAVSAANRAAALKPPAEQLLATKEARNLSMQSKNIRICTFSSVGRATDS